MSGPGTSESAAAPRRLRAVIADDEPLARETLRGLLALDPELEVVGICGDAASARELILAARCDLALLDVEMPGGGGFAALSGVPAERLPAVVFVTAYSHYAPRAFDVEAIDYVVKPFSDERLRAALERAKRRVRERRVGFAAARLRELAAQLAGPAAAPAAAPSWPVFVERLEVRAGERTVLVAVADLLWIGSEDYYVRLYAAGGARHLLRASLAGLERRLDPSRWLRIHRNALVNLPAVVEVVGQRRGARRLRLRDGTVLPVGRARWPAVAAALRAAPADGPLPR